MKDIYELKIKMWFLFVEFNIECFGIYSFVFISWEIFVDNFFFGGGLFNNYYILKNKGKYIYIYVLF